MSDEDTRFTEDCHAYFDGAMSPAESARFLGALTPEQKRMLNAYAQIHNLVAEHGQIEAPQGLAEKIQARIAQEPAIASADNRTTSIWSRKWRLKAAAAVLLIAGTVLVLRPGDMQPGAGLANQLAHTPATEVATRQIPTDPASSVSSPSHPPAVHSVTPDSSEVPNPPDVNTNMPTVPGTSADGKAAPNQSVSMAMAPAKSYKGVHMASTRRAPSLSDEELENELVAVWTELNSLNYEASQTLDQINTLPAIY